MLCFTGAFFCELRPGIRTSFFWSFPLPLNNLTLLIDNDDDDDDVEPCALTTYIMAHH